jgi:arylsulfatase
VNDLDYKVPFRFNGKINKLTYNLGPSQLSAEEKQTVKKAVAKAKD